MHQKELVDAFDKNEKNKSREIRMGLFAEMQRSFLLYSGCVDCNRHSGCS